MKSRRAAILWGIGVAAAQSAAAWVVSLTTIAASPADAYKNLCRWDCIWYWRISSEGYHSVIPPVADNADLSNVAFFPGYPVAARAVHAITAVSWDAALVLTAQLACAAFWTYVFLLLRKWNVDWRARVLCVAAILLHPAAFYLVTGYSESLFFALTLGFAYWLSTRNEAATTTHAIAMSATRLVGVPTALFSFLIPGSLPGEAQARSWRLRAILALPALAGALAFFAFCQLRFGHWDLYFWSQRIGWEVVPQPFVLAKPSTYIEPFKKISAVLRLAPYATSQISVPIFTGELLAVLALEWVIAKRRREPTESARAAFRERLAFYLVAWIAFDIAASGVAAVGMRSMLRHTLFSHVLVVLAATRLAGDPATWTWPWARRKWRTPWIAAAFIFAVFVGLAAFTIGAFQIALLKNYVVKYWVA